MRLYVSATFVAGTLIFAGLACFMLVTLVAGPDHTRQEVPLRLLSPGPGHLFGTDHLGRDFASRIGWAMRGSVLTAGIVTLISGIGGGFLGLVAGYLGGRVDSAVQRAVDLVMAVPLVVLALAIVAAYGQGAWVVAGALSVAFLPLPVRVTRAAALSLRRAEFVDAAKVAGAGRFRIATRHIARNVTGPWSAVVAAQAGGALLAESALSFVGAGGGRSLGALLTGEAQAFVYTAPWLALFPGAAIFLLALSANLVGEGFGRGPRGG